MISQGPVPQGVTPAGERLELKQPKKRFLSILALVLLLAACGGASGDATPTSGVTGCTPPPTSVPAPTSEPDAADVRPGAVRATTIVPGVAATGTPVRVPTTVALVKPTLAPTSSPGKAPVTKPQGSRGRAVSVPDFQLVAYQGEELLGGREVRFSEVFEQGKPVVLNFWAGNCPPCRLEMPSFQAVADKYDDEVVFVGVDVGLFTGLGDHESARQLLDELYIRYPSAYAADAAALRQYKVINMPTTIFFDAEGRVVARRSGIVLEDELGEIVDQLVAGS